MEKIEERCSLPTTSPSSSSPGSEKLIANDQSDESSEENIPMPISLIGAENYLTLTEGRLCALTKEELTEAISKCKNLILDSVVCSEERKWLVRRLIELRYQLLTAKDVQEESFDSEKEDSRIVIGHHLKLRYVPTSTTKRYCDVCCRSIWNIVHSWYQCSDCRYRCHNYCVDQIKRPCAHLSSSEKPHYETRICPEVGLAAQDYQCAECELTISFKNAWEPPRQCDYTGLYYCTSCHWNNSAVIPARVLQNWDFKPYPVCRATYQLLRFNRNRIYFKLDPRFYGFVKELGEVKRLREELSMMKLYLVQCREAKAEKKLLWNHFGSRSHLLQNHEFLTMQDLIGLHNQELLVEMKQLTSRFSDHIVKNCTICRGGGYRCEFCLCDENDDYLFPFYSTVYICPECSWVYHKECQQRHLLCRKCERNRRKKLVNPSEPSDL